MRLEGASIVCLSSIDWSFSRQIPQEVALALAQRGNRVLYIENTGVRRPNLQDISRIALRLRNWWHAGGRVNSLAEGVDVFSPLILPFPYSRAATRVNTHFLGRTIRNWLRGSAGPLILIAFLPTPLARAIATALVPDLVVYYCIDLFAASSNRARRIATSEQRLIKESDLVLVTSPALLAMVKQFRLDVELLSSGVRTADYEQARERRVEPHPSFQRMQRPIVGYMGSLRHAIDIKLLERVADLAPDLQFVIGGPRFVDVSSLAARQNVRLLDAIPHADVIDHMVRFDVGLLPYSINEFTSAIMPVKLKEYLAAGLPVIATPLPAVLRFAEQHPGLVHFARDANEFLAALRMALTNGHPNEVARRIAVARQYDWNCQMERLIELMQQELAAPSSPKRDQSTSIRLQ